MNHIYLNNIGGTTGGDGSATGDVDLSNYQKKIADLSTIRSGAAAGATAVQPDAIADMETQTHAAATYQPIGTYLTSHQDISGKQDKLTEAQLANLNEDHSKYLTAHQDISGKQDKLTEAQLAVLNTDHSVYLTAHQDITGKQDKSTLETDVKAFINASYIASLIEDGTNTAY